MRACGVRVCDTAHARLTILFCKTLSLHLSFCSAVPSVQSVDGAVLLIINGAALLHELIRVRTAILAKMNRIVVVIVRRLCIKAERVIVLLFY